MNQDTEQIAFPPIQHEEPKGDIVKVDLTLNPIHCFYLPQKPYAKTQPSARYSNYSSIGYHTSKILLNSPQNKEKQNYEQKSKMLSPIQRVVSDPEITLSSNDKEVVYEKDRARLSLKTQRSGPDHRTFKKIHQLAIISKLRKTKKSRNVGIPSQTKTAYNHKTTRTRTSASARTEVEFSDTNHPPRRQNPSSFLIDARTESGLRSTRARDQRRPRSGRRRRKDQGRQNHRKRFLPDTNSSLRLQRFERDEKP